MLVLHGKIRNTLKITKTKRGIGNYQWLIEILSTYQKLSVQVHYVPARLQVSKSSKTGHQVVSKITYAYICILYDTKKYIQITTLKINKNVKSKKKT